MVCWLALWLLAFGAVEAAKQQRDFKLILDEIYLKPEKTDLFENLKWLVEKDKIVSVWLSVKRDIDQMDVESTLDMKKPNNQTIRLYQIHFDAFLFLSSIQKNRLFNIWAKILNKNSNLECPLKAHRNYTISKVSMDESDLPKYVPECSYRSLTKFYIRKNLVLRLLVAGRVKYN